MFKMLLILLRANIHIIFKKAKYLHAFLKRKYDSKSVLFTIPAPQINYIFNILNTCKTTRTKLSFQNNLNPRTFLPPKRF